MLTFTFQLIIGLLGLYFGAEWLVKGSVSLAKYFKIPPVIIGLTIVGYGTSLPELVVSMEAAWMGQGDIALGNVIGSNICNIGLIGGISLLINPTLIAPQLIKTEIPIMLLVSIIFYLILIFSNQVITRSIGISLCLSFIIYTLWLIFTAPKIANKELESEFVKEIPKTYFSLITDIILVVMGLIILSVSGNFFLKGVVGIGRILGISEAIIGLSVIAISTSLPELATSILAAIRKHGDISIGNIVGSNIYNILGVVGLSSTLAPLHFNNIRWIDSTVMLAFAILFTIMILIRNQLARIEGFILLVLYILYITHLYYA